MSQPKLSPEIFVKRDHTGRLLVYKKYNGSSDLKYCYAIDEKLQKIVHMCEKYDKYYLNTFITTY